MNIELSKNLGFYPNVTLLIDLVDKEVEMFTDILTKLTVKESLTDEERAFLIQIIKTL